MVMLKCEFDKNIKQKHHHAERHDFYEKRKKSIAWAWFLWNIIIMWIEKKYHNLISDNGGESVMGFNSGHHQKAHLRSALNKRTKFQLSSMIWAWGGRSLADLCSLPLQTRKKMPLFEIFFMPTIEGDGSTLGRRGALALYLYFKKNVCLYTELFG